MKKIIILVLLCFLPTIGFAETIELAPNAKSAILMEMSTGEIIYQKNVHERLAPASMTKIMSLLLIMEQLENGNLTYDEKVRASKNAASMGGSQIFLQENEEMTVNDLLKGIAVASGNDATVAMAERIAGTEEAFVEMMNQRAKELGLKNTNFKNCTGLDEANHYSSAYDMSKMARELLKHENILKYSSIYEDYLREGTDRKFWLVNTNKLVRFYPGVDGLKTGFTDTAKYCLTATAKKNNLRLISVVMGEESTTLRSADTSKMLDYGFSQYSLEMIHKKSDSLGEIALQKAKVDRMDVVPLEDITLLNKKSSGKREITKNVVLSGNYQLPLKQGDVIGYVELIEQGKVIKKVDVTVRQDVIKASLVDLFYKYLKDMMTGKMTA